MKPIAQPESLGAETLEDTALDSVRGGALRDNLKELRPITRLPRLPVLTVLKPLPIRWPYPPPPDPVEVLGPVLR